MSTTSTGTGASAQMPEVGAVETKLEVGELFHLDGAPVPGRGWED